MRRGDGRLPVVPTRDGRVATAICYDADFPEFMRQAGQGSADILIVPANDWKEIKSVHFQMAVVPGDRERCAARSTCRLGNLQRN